MTTDIPAHNQPAAVRDRLSFLFGLLGVRTAVTLCTVGGKPVIAFSPLWLGDAHTLSEALSRVSEVRPYDPESRARPSGEAATP